MSYFAESNHIEYDAWFDANIDPLDLLDYLKIKNVNLVSHVPFICFLKAINWI